LRYLLQLSGIQTLRPPRSLSIGKTGQTVPVETLHPIFHRARAITHQLCHLWSAHSLGDQKNSVQPMIVARLLRPPYLILQSQKHFLSVIDRA